MSGYNRQKAAEYAKEWAYSRNSKYYNFDNLGGDCTNFISQCLYAGIGEMNYTAIYGWYYINLNNRAPAWTGVQELYTFLMRNRGSGAKAKLSTLSELEIGDIIQLGDRNGEFYHSLFVLETGGNPLVAAHTDDALYRPLSSYRFDEMRALHIIN